jgi:hypothetical protein
MRSSHACLLLLVVAVSLLGSPLHSSAQDPSEPASSRYVNYIDVNKGVRLSQFTAWGQSLGFYVVNGIQLHPILSLGIGAGVDFYNGNISILLPLFADVRLLFKPDHEVWTPIFSIGTGYAFSPARESMHGGFYCAPAFGAHFHATKHLDLTLGLGYRYQYSEFEYRTRFIEYPMRTLVMRVGVGIR